MDLTIYFIGRLLYVIYLDKNYPPPLFVRKHFREQLIVKKSRKPSKRESKHTACTYSVIIESKRIIKMSTDIGNSYISWK